MAAIDAAQRPPGYGITVTGLLSCVRKMRLEQEYNYFERPDQLYWSWRGTVMHTAPERAATDLPLGMTENRFTAELPNGFELSGQPDLVLLDKSHIVDYKFTKRVPGKWRTYTCPETGGVIQEGRWAYRNKWIDCPHCEEGQHIAKEICQYAAPRPYGRHILQLSAYAWLLAKNGITVNTGEIVYADMEKPLRIAIDLLPLDEIEPVLIEASDLFMAEDLPSFLTDEDALWECEYCPVREVCEEEAGHQVGKAMNTELAKFEAEAAEV